MKDLFKYQNKKYTQDDLIKTLYNLGIKKGDIICVHNEIYSFGIPLLPIKDFLNALIECLFEVIGENGTLIMPTFTYSFCNNEVYDKLNSKCIVGALGEFFRKQAGVKRTNDPIFSFAIKGAKEDLFLNQEQESCFDENCLYAILVKNKGKILNFGNRDCFTFAHYPMEKVGVDYRYFKEFKGLIIDEKGQNYHKSIQYYVREIDAYETDEKIIKFLENKSYFHKIAFGGTFLNLIDAQAFYEDLIQAYKQDGHIFRAN
ncbi:AAC(3) family N-acetyltransferase [Campylobacter taeniopygiae]|uniref:AAC(3) family N-acetyltransferase n=1 Tax=Campylobacter taeniopygiae TaxID=2510188 RepID=UPI003D6C6849